jgi:hypothetical protein
MSNAYKIIQSAKNFTVYPEVPLSVWLPAPVSTTTNQTGLVAFIFAQRSSYGFNVGQLSSYTPDPNIYDDHSSSYSKKAYIVNLGQEGSMSPPLSPPVISPDASWNFLSAYAFFAPAAKGTQQIFIADPGNTTSPPSSPPIVVGRPVFDGGIYAVVFEVGNGSGSPFVPGANSTFDKAGAVSSDQPTIGASLITTTGANEAILEAAILMDSSSITPAPAVSPVVSQYQYAEKYPAGSSQWIIFSSLGNSGAYASKGFLNPIEYTGGVLAISVK